MRLLRIEDDGSLSLVDVGDNVPGRYAVLSHTWGADSEEPNFWDLSNNSGKSKAGYKKIAFCQSHAAADNIRYFWVDNCCIDKSSSAELTEALNSMFRWYRDACKCYVYLSDVSSREDTSSNSEWQIAFRQSRWFTRGWTLQELLAPALVEFFSAEGRWLGNKKSLQREIHEITGIPVHALLGAPLSRFSVNERMSWALNRKTTREEDAAYALLGIFEVFMPPIYGERRRNAFQRLESEIERSLHQENGEGRSNAYNTTYDLPFSWNQTPVVRTFLGRQDETNQIRQHFKPDETRKVVTLQGLGGIGKTQLALAYVWKYRREFSAIFWFNCSSIDVLKQGLSDAAKRIQVHNPHLKTANTENLDASINLALQWFSRPGNTRWLIIFDNYDSPKFPGHYNPLSFDIKQFFPNGDHGSILITTRSSTWKMGRSIALEKFSNKEEALQILSSISGREDLMQDPYAHKLCDILDGLPLALAAAGIHLSQVSTSIANYLQLYDYCWYRLQQQSQRRFYSEDKILFTTWNISLAHVCRQSAVAANLLKLWAFFDNNDVWFELLNTGYQFGPRWFRELCQDRASFDEAVQILFDHGFIEPDPFPSITHRESAGYNMHHCVHSWVINVLNWTLDEDFARLAVHCVGIHAPSYENPERWILQRRLLPHAMRFQQKGHYQVLGTAQPVQNPVSDLRGIGSILKGQLKYDEAEAVLLYALRFSTLSPDSWNEATVAVYNSLGSLYLTTGNYAQAKEIITSAVRLAGEIGDGTNGLYLQSLANLGMACTNGNKLEEAEETLYSALQYCELHFPRACPTRFWILSGLGHVFYRQKRLVMSETFYEQALAGTAQVYGSEHPETLRILVELGQVHTDRGNFASAERVLKRALASFNKIQGKSAPQTLSAVHCLGAMYLKPGM